MQSDFWQGLWFTELHGKTSGITIKIKKILKSIETQYQKLDVFETEDYGRLLTLDNLVMTTERDEFIYHEMLAHIPMFSHNNPENVLIIGGGDGGTLREVLKHKTVKNVDMVEIDKEVVNASKEFFPTLSVGFDNPRTNLKFVDGVEFVRNKEDIYDVIIIDSTDPIGPGKVLFTEEFYKNCYKALKKNGIFVSQTESPFHNPEWVQDIYSELKKVFPIVKAYKAEIPTYPSGIWTFSFCSENIDPIENFQKIKYGDYNLKLKYYNDEIHKGAFALPNFVKELI